MGRIIALFLMGAICTAAAASPVQPAGDSRSDNERPGQVHVEPSGEDQFSPSSAKPSLQRLVRAPKSPNASGQPPDEAERAKRDLYAQQSMAKWAFWMFVTAATQVFLSGLGILYIRRTLQNSAEATAGFKGVEKAYLLLQDIKIGGIQDDGAQSGFSFRIGNHGRSPAWLLGATVQTLVAKSLPDEIPEAPEMECVWAIPPGESQAFGELLRPDPKQFKAYLAAHGSPEPLQFYVWGRLRYRDMFNDTRYSRFAYSLVLHGGENGADTLVPVGSGKWWEHT